MRITVRSPHEPGHTPCPRCHEPKPITRTGECFRCEHHDKARAKRIARERAVATYGKDRC
jgi:hypothetical protein